MKNENKKYHLRANTYLGFLNQIVILICGLVLPRLILSAYGSSVNGLVNSITSILNVISLLELGVGAVVQTALYKPLAEQNDELVNKIMSAAKRFFFVIGCIFIIYVFIAGITFSIINQKEYDFCFTILLFLAISISMLAQYFFGMANNLLIKADQKIYLLYIAQMVSVLLNTLACYILIKFGFSIQIVKLTTSIIYLIRPIFSYIYVKRKFNLKYYKKNGENILPQKWNGLSQHIAAYVLENTDILVLTFFSTLQNVSIYSIYYMIVKALHQLIYSLSGGIQSYYGSLYAVGNIDLLKNQFRKFTFLICGISTLFFCIAIVSINSFVLVYTQGVNDANYNNLLFGILLCIGQFLFCYRYCFNVLIIAMGKFRETQFSAIVEAIINLSLSIIFVLFWGLIGVAIGTIIALIFRIIYFVIFLQRHEIDNSMILFIKTATFATLGLAASILIALLFPFSAQNYFEWFFMTCLYSLVIIGIVVLFMFLADHKLMIDIFQRLIRRRK